MSLLSVQRRGAGPTLVWLHGFTQTRDSAHQFTSILAGSHEVWTIDLPGHGSAHQVTADLTSSAALVAEVLGGEPVVLGGYSMGARVALHVALDFPDKIDALVLLGATRGIADEAERAARRERDEQLATHLLEIGIEQFLDEWLSQPMFATLPADVVERQARSHDARGLASSLRLCGTGTQAWLGPRLHELKMPILALAGSRDEKFLLEAHAIAESVAHGRFDEVPLAGHAAHLEQPNAVAARVEAFLS